MDKDYKKHPKVILFLPLRNGVLNIHLYKQN